MTAFCGILCNILVHVPVEKAINGFKFDIEARIPVRWFQERIRVWNSEELGRAKDNFIRIISDFEATVNIVVRQFFEAESDRFGCHFICREVREFL